ncbi:MAG: hypothetical protein ACKO43_04835, partial [Alphaproteobacteria bacterium]
ANPWLGGDPADDKNDYYIHICYPYTYNTITPLPNLTGGTIPETKVLNNKSLAYITKEISCPNGQVLQSFTGGTANCVAKDSAGATCPSGQVVTGVVNGVPTCSNPPSAVPVCNDAGKALQFDGVNWRCRNQTIEYTGCNWTGWFGGRGRNGTDARYCAAGYSQVGLEHQNDGGHVGFNPHDEAFRIRCCRLVIQ